jgi:hypothetical protein
VPGLHIHHPLTSPSLSLFVRLVDRYSRKHWKFDGFDLFIVRDGQQRQQMQHKSAGREFRSETYNVHLTYPKCSPKMLRTDKVPPVSNRKNDLNQADPKKMHGRSCLIAHTGRPAR